LNKKYLTITVHIAAWACFFLLPIVFFPRPKDPNFQINEGILWMFVTMDAFLVAFYYSNTNVFIPKLLTQRKWGWYTLIIIACLLLFTYIPRLFEELIREEAPQRLKDHFKPRRHHLIPYPFSGSTAVFFLVFTVSTCSRVIQEWLSTEKKNEQIERDKLVTELSFLKTQINPHFLFNTLNNIYSLALIKSDATAGAVLKLSSIMRYVLNETKHDWVPLEKEIEFVNHFIDLQKVRLTDKMKINFTVTGNIEGKQIAPLILIPFIENAFKYGISTKEPAEIIIDLKAEDNVISFYVKNKIFTTEHDKNGHSIGLKNTRRRLELLYPEKHTLTVSDENRYFIVNLTLSK
jgi:two-component system, LytTR family, sensor kinase